MQVRKCRKVGPRTESKQVRQVSKLQATYDNAFIISNVTYGKVDLTIG